MATSLQAQNDLFCVVSMYFHCLVNEELRIIYFYSGDGCSYRIGLLIGRPNSVLQINLRVIAVHL